MWYIASAESDFKVLTKRVSMKRVKMNQQIKIKEELSLILIKDKVSTIRKNIIGTSVRPAKSLFKIKSLKPLNILFD